MQSSESFGVRTSCATSCACNIFGLYCNSSLIDIIYSLQLLENIQASVSRIEERLITSSDVSNLERRLEVLEQQAAENH